ncbi:amino acid adenylation domain-containing protein [Paenibacillus cellulosilyticus]|nr:amino acid adenylation domain-containing protein [Paenibacillus cellulosilyticus]
MTAMQEGMLYHRLVDDSVGHYFVQNMIRFDCKLDAGCVEQSLLLLAQKHAVLRTSIFYKKVKQPRNIILKDRTIGFSAVDLTDLSALAKNERLAEIKRLDAENHFDLEKDPLMRVCLVKMEEQHYKLLWSFHHIIMDGWCMSLVMKDFLDNYTLLQSGKPLKALLQEMQEASRGSAKYEDYIKWLSAQDKGRSLEYWGRLLSDYEQGAEIPPLLVGHESTKQADSVKASLTKDTSEGLLKLSHQLNCTVNTIVETAWGLLLQTYNGTGDAVFGKVVSGRNADIRGIEHTVGLFINTIPVRVNNSKNLRFSQLIQELQEQSLESNLHDFCSLVEIQEKSSLKDQLIRTLVAFENYYVDEELGEGGGLPFEVESMEEQTSYPITLLVHVADTLKMEVLYDAGLYGQLEMERLLDTLSRLLIAMVQSPEAKIHEVDLLSEAEKKQILIDFNQTELAYEKSKTLHELFEEQVLRTPGHHAVTFNQEHMTYEALNQRANQLARTLRKGNTSGARIIGIMVSRKPEMLIAILAVLKSGYAYLPIDPEYPLERIQHMLEDSGAAILLTEDPIMAALDLDFHGEIIDVQREGSYDADSSNLPSISAAEDLAYVIYTSGSTGKPKGVMIEQSSVHNLIEGVSRQIRFTEGKSILNLTTISFDIFVIETILPLLKGMRVVIMDEAGQKDSSLIIEAIQREQINIVQTTPSRMKILIGENATIEHVFSSVQEIIVTGEALPKHLANTLKTLFSCEIYNMYGPTETTVWSALQNVRSENKVTIGKPLANTKAYIVNSHQQIQPIGIYGELCISGDGVARGYLNRPELTQEKFTDNPFSQGERMYRTGDLARWLPDGTIEYFGRMDEQIKIRGYRIELGEIESAIRKQTGIRDVAVIAKSDSSGDKYICAYVVSDQPEQEADAAQIKQELRKVLPSFMIPAYIIGLNKLPVTANGKLDRRSLPEPVNQRKEHIVAPRNSLEETLADIFKEVLGLEQLSIHDHFFEIGGHSLKATRVVNMTEAKTSLRIPLKVFFERSTIAELSEYLAACQNEAVYHPIPLSESKDVYPLSPAQRRVFYIHQMDDLGTVYNMPGVLEIRGKLNVGRVKDVIRQLTERHESLRTSFIVSGDHPVQRIEDSVEVEVEVDEGLMSVEALQSYAEVAAMSKGAVEENQALKLMAEDLLQPFVRPFHLEEAPLIRVKVVKAAEEHYLLMFDMHHIITDGASMNTITKEFSLLYNGQALKTPHIQYKDYCEWMSARDLGGQEAYWTEQFSGEIPVLELPLDFPRQQTKQYTGSSIHVSLNGTVKSDIRELCKQTGTTEYMLLLSAFMILLGKYSGQEDIVIGSPVSGRTHQDTEALVGMFVNTLAMRGRPERGKTFTAFLQEMKEICLKAMDHQEYPFEELVDKVQVQREMSRHPLFDVMFALQDMEEEWTAEGLTFNMVELENKAAKFDLTMIVNHTDDGYDMTWEYSDKLFKEETVHRMAVHFEQIIREAVRQPWIPLQDIDVATPAEKQQILFDFNNTRSLYPKEKSIQQLFQEQVIRTPDAEAVISEQGVLTYEQLDQRSDEISGELQRRGIQAGQLIGIVSEKSADMIAGILAIVKCGCGYVPLDGDYPESRLRFMLEDCQIDTILHGSGTIGTGAWIPEGTHRIDIRERYEGFNLAPYAASPSDTAYVVYTSGSTGVPKGVVVSHQNVVRLVQHTDYVDFSDARILQTGALSFDATTFEIWGSLLNGGVLCLVDSDIFANPGKLADLVEQNRLNTMFLTSQLFNNLVDLDMRWMKGMKNILTGGQAISERHVNKLLQHHQGLTLIHCYGPTENTTFSLTYKVEHPQVNIPIGQPIGNSTAYIMNGSILSGIGLPGELCVGGDGVAKGYLNRDELTREKFIENPYVPGERIYRTGDLARWLPDGNIEFLGRMDEQVKIRGYRIELGEIETVLRQQDGIKDAAVLVRKDGEEDRYLCAYIVGEDQEQAVNLTQLKDKIRQELPAYMIPAYFVQLEQLPATANGKLDRRALPQPEQTTMQTYAAPRNDLETILTDVFSEVLGLERVGIDDSFFEMGGDSIKAIRIISKLREHGYELDVKTLIQHREIRTISSKVQKAQADNLEIYQQPVAGVVQRTPIQHQFYEWELSRPEHFNQAIMIHSAGGFNEDLVRTALEQLAKHHDALRSRFDERGTHSICGVDEGQLYELTVVEYRDLGDADALAQAVEEHCNAIQASMDLKKGPLLKAALFHANDGTHLFFCVHHLVVDGVSWRILLEDFSTAYSQARDHQTISLPSKTASYQAWAEGLIAFSKSYLLKRELGYWKEVSHKIDASVPLSETACYKDAQKLSGAAVTVNHEFMLTREETDRLLHESGTAYNTEINDLLLAALSMTVQQCFGVGSVGIELESHGRHPIEPQIRIDRTVGWFTNTYPVVLECHTDDLGATIKHTKETLRKVPNYGLGYGILKYLSDPEIRTQLAPLQLELSFNYLGDFSSEGDGGEFSFSKLGCGSVSSDENKFQKPITVDCIVQEGQMAFTIGFNHSEMDVHTRFSEVFAASLRTIIAHCSSHTGTQYTLSDYGDEIGWSDSELDDVLSLFEGDEND